jgi:hypothetical protein
MPETPGRRRQTEILARLGEGPWSVSALVAAFQPDAPEATLRALRLLQAKRAVVVTGRPSPKKLSGAVVALAVGQPPVAAKGATGRPATMVETVKAWEAFLG